MELFGCIFLLLLLEWTAILLYKAYSFFNLTNSNILSISEEQDAELYKNERSLRILYMGKCVLWSGPIGWVLVAIFILASMATDKYTSNMLEFYRNQSKQQTQFTKTKTGEYAKTPPQKE